MDEHLENDRLDDSTTAQPDDTITAPPSDSLGLEELAAPHLSALDGFDPAIHATGPDGQPKRRADGSYALKRGRKAGAQSGGAKLPKPGEAQKAPESDGLTPEGAAIQSANVIVNLCVFACGEEIGAPRNKDEADGLKNAFKNYYDARGVPNFPPEIGLFIGLFAYAAPRLMHEKTQTKFQKIKESIILKIAKLRGA